MQLSTVARPHHHRTHRLRSALTLALVVSTGLSIALVPGVGAPAQAAESLFLDPDDALGADIRRVRVVNTGGDLSVRVRMDRIVENGRNREQALQLFVDTDPRTPGPEYQLATGLNTGTDWTLREMKSWTKRGPRATCDHDVSINWAQDRVVLSIAKECIGATSSVRVALKAGEWTPKEGTRTDWFPKSRGFSASVSPR